MHTLRRRLLLSSSIVLLVFVGAMAVALNRAFEKSVLSNAQDALRSQILLLLTDVEVLDGRIVLPVQLAEARLSQTDSTLFAQISSAHDGVVWRSPSLLDETLPLLPSVLGDYRFQRYWAWDTKPNTFNMTLGIEWETDAGDLPLTVQVAEYSQSYDQRLARYQRQFGLWLFVLAAVLLGLLLTLLNWAIKPLARVSKQVAQIEQGERQRFDEDYPPEVSQLTQNLNQLLNHEEQRINRQKEVLGNLAHSLKTPMAILRGFDYDKHNSSDVHSQLATMQQIIDYQLHSASAVGRRRFAKPVLIQQASQRLINSLQKLYQDKALTIELNMNKTVKFYGDTGDWTELLGNLVDNACKWAQSRVWVEVVNLTESARLGMQIIVNDDGPGIDPALRTTILQRGVRLDSQTPGHGLGLHIVKGIVEVYNGTIDIEELDSGGTSFIVTLL